MPCQIGTNRDAFSGWGASPPVKSRAFSALRPGGLPRDRYQTPLARIIQPELSIDNARASDPWPIQLRSRGHLFGRFFWARPFMDLKCNHCNRVIEYSSEPPRFCSHCGGELSDTGTGGLSDDTHTYHIRFTDDRADLPDVIGGYKLLGELGRGGMGVVFEAEQKSTGRRVAIKLLSTNVRRTDATVRRFMQEGELAASLSHPRSTFVYAAGEEGGQFFIVMELMSGGTLKDLVQREERLPVERAVDFTLDVMEGLEAAHSAGVIHRDVKPSNCFLDQHGRAKVGDYDYPSHS